MFQLLDRNTELARADGASKENLHFDDQRKQVVSPLFVAMFSKRNRKHVLRISTVLVPTAFLVLPNRVSITRQKHGTCFLFLKWF